MEELRGRFCEGMERLHQITGPTADRIYEKMAAFANFGFPGKPFAGFASLVFYSAWLKLHHPAAFCAALLRAQPMGFSPAVAGRRRPAAQCRCTGHINASLSWATLEKRGHRTAAGPRGGARGGRRGGRADRRRNRDQGGTTPTSTTCPAAPNSTSGISKVWRVRALSVASVSAAVRHSAGGCCCAAARADQLRLETSVPAPVLPGLSEISSPPPMRGPPGSPPEPVPDAVPAAAPGRDGVIPADRLLSVADGARVLVGGAVTHRQRPATASG